METENSSKMPIFFGIIFVIFILIGVLTWYFTGSKGLLSFLLYFMITLVIVFIIFLIIFAVWWLFSKQRMDTIHVNKQRILKACIANPPATSSTLWFRGNHEWESKLIGYITGVCRLVFKKEVTEKDDDGNDIMGDDGKPLKVLKDHFEDAISFRKSLGIVASIIGGDSIVRVLPEERTNLNGDRVYLKGMAFAPEKFGFFFLSSRFKYDEVKAKLTSEIRDVTLQEVLKEEVNIANDAIAISPAHQKALERSNMQTISQPDGGGGGGK